ncbi:hypothetical protein LINGRAHAP2_LOCUS2268, partial [Linum grandiflorum]
ESCELFLLNKLVCGLMWGRSRRPSLLCFFSVFSEFTEASIQMTTLSRNALDR